MNSNATRTRFWAFSTESVPSSQGRTARAGAERIGAGAAERVPVDDAEPQVVAHRLAFDLFVGVVMPEGERVLGLGAFVADAFDFGKCGLHGSPGAIVIGG